jgi:hypothetical protein
MHLSRAGIPLVLRCGGMPDRFSASFVVLTDSMRMVLLYSTTD